MSTQVERRLHQFFAQIMDTYSMMVHSGHQHVVDLALGATVAVGVQMGHGELELAGQRVVAAYRYDDEYRCVEGRWLFARRQMRYQYFSTHDGLGQSLSGRQRVRLPGAEPRDAEIPEELPSYRDSAGGPRGEGVVVEETDIGVARPIDRVVAMFRDVLSAGGETLTGAACGFRGVAGPAADPW